MDTTPRFPLAHFTKMVAADNRTILCVGPFCWGKGKTGKEAYRNARKYFSSYHGGQVSNFVFYSAAPDAYVDGMGYLCYQDADNPPAQLGVFRSTSKGGR